MWFSVLVAIIVIAFLSSKKRYRWFYILYKTLPRDIRAAKGFIKLNWFLLGAEKRQSTIAKEFTAIARKQPNKVAFYFEDEVWTFAQLDEFSNKIGNYFKGQGYKKGDTIALIIESRPEYVGIWLGLAKAGITTALINYNLVNDPLLHSIRAAGSKAIIYGSVFAEGIKNILPSLQSVKLYQFHETQDGDKEILQEAANLRDGLKSTSSAPLEEVNLGQPRDKVIYIYTSGTTGLPKAAIINNLRYMFAAKGMTIMTELKEGDVVYDPLPLYHTAGGILGAGQAVVSGLPVAIRKKFSASNFWKDCAKYNCTIAQYIGEICRYLLAAQGNSEPVKHNVKKMIGNGLRAQIWTTFMNKFKIERIYELYGATEGNSNLINIDNTVGSVGFLPRYASSFYPLKLIRCDEAGLPIRNEEGCCILCEPHEEGLLIGKINAKQTIHSFTGYADEKATHKKILENVLEKGDRYFNSGDVLTYDEYGNFFFKDRTGDTFRWKGENVSTAEVEAVVSNAVELKDVVVYGVQVPNTEGRVGMAAIMDKEKTINLDSLCKSLKRNLASYAQPMFIRVMESLPMTGTFKLKKVELQEEAFNITKIKDPVYFYDAKLGKYISFTKELYDNILCGAIRL